MTCSPESGAIPGTLAPLNPVGNGPLKSIFGPEPATCLGLGYILKSSKIRANSKLNLELITLLN